MSQKIHQLDMFKSERETFEELTTKTFRAIFAYIGARDKAIMAITENVTAMQDILLRMDDRLNRLAEK
jgi:hypothetical protein